MSKVSLFAICLFLSEKDEDPMVKVRETGDAHAFATLVARWEGPIHRLCAHDWRRAPWRGSLQQIRSDNSSAIANAETRLAKASAAQTQQLWRGFFDVLAATRVEDKHAVQAALQECEEKHSTQFLIIHINDVGASG